MSIKGIDPVPRGKTLAEDIYDRLRAAIMAGSVRPGEKISARAVAESAAVSFTPAREAVARLISEGALELSGPKSVVVPTLDLEAIAEITQIRLNVECMAAEIAVANFSKSDINDLEGIQKNYEKVRNIDNFADSLTVNELFHFTIYRKCEMPRLIAIIESLWLQIGPSFNLLSSDNGLSGKPLDYHREAIKGLRAKNGARVRDAIASDIKFGFERLKTTYNS